MRHLLKKTRVNWNYFHRGTRFSPDQFLSGSLTGTCNYTTCVACQNTAATRYAWELASPFPFPVSYILSLSSRVEHATHPKPDAHPSVALELGLREYRVGQAVVRSYRFLLRLTIRRTEGRWGTAERTQQCVRYMPKYLNTSCRQGKPLPG